VKISKFFKVISIAFSLALLGVMAVGLPANAAAPTTFGVTPDHGPAGSTVTVWGTWAQSQLYNVYFDTTTPIGSTIVPDRQLSLQVTIPATAMAGTHYITAVGSIDGSTAPVPFTVSASLMVTPNIGNVGDNIYITGSGFTAGLQVPILWDGTQIAVATANGAGVVSTSVTIPECRRGDHALSTNLVSGSTTVTVNSKIVLDKTSGGSGETVTVKGTGFGYPENVTISGMAFASSVSASTTTLGSFSTTFVVPSTAARGTYTITATGVGGSATAIFTVAPKIYLTLPTGQTSVSPGDVITINGNNFSTGNVIFKLDGSVLSNLTAVADTTGTFSGVTFTVPNLPARSTKYEITATGSDSMGDGETFSIVPKVVLSATSVNTGSQVTISGYGFAASATVTITIPGGTSLTATTDTSGTITGTPVFTVPNGVGGSKTVRVTDGINSATATYDLKPKVTLSQADAVYDASITATGSGFAASADISLHIQSGQTEYYLNTIPSAVKVDSNGSWSAVFTVPLVTNGNWNIRAYVGSDYVTSTVLAVKASIVLSPDSGASGDEVSVSGFGFNPGKSITLKYNGTAIKTTGISADGNGYFAAVFNVPASAAGTFSVEATDNFATAKADFVSVAGAVISVTTDQNTPGYVGQEVTISGTGFKPSTSIIITIESTAIQVATVTSSAQGSFTATFTIPAVAKGNHVIRASDGSTTKEFAYYMEGTAPSKVELVAPVDKFKPKQPIPFSWNPRNDPSGVTYEFQLSRDASFSTVLLSKTGLTASSYVLSAADSVTIDGKLYSANKLPSSGDTPYCWRVRAIDGAGNAGPWSEVNTFTIGFIMPSWMIHVWYGLGILVALILGLWLGRRMAYQSY
jgi:hypothetical protein